MSAQKKGMILTARLFQISKTPRNKTPVWPGEACSQGTLLHWTLPDVPPNEDEAAGNIWLVKI